MVSTFFYSYIDIFILLFHLFTYLFQDFYSFSWINYFLLQHYQCFFFLKKNQLERCCLDIGFNLQYFAYIMDKISQIGCTTTSKGIFPPTSQVFSYYLLYLSGKVYVVNLSSNGLLLRDTFFFF